MLVPGGHSKKTHALDLSHSRPSAPNFIHANVIPNGFHFPSRNRRIQHGEISSCARGRKRPSDVTSQRPDGFVIFRMSMCSAIILSYRRLHRRNSQRMAFLPKQSIPAVADPYDQISRVSENDRYIFLSRCWPRRILIARPGISYECKPRTNSPSSPSTSSTREPTRAIMCMFRTT